MCLCTETGTCPQKKDTFIGPRLIFPIDNGEMSECAKEGASLTLIHTVLTRTNCVNAF